MPVAYGHRDVWVRGYVDRVVIGCGGEVIARHPRSYEREDTIFEPIHYLPPIEQKIGALDSGGAACRMGPAARVPDPAPPDGSALGPGGGGGSMCRFLRLLESFGLEDLHSAVKDALRLGAIGFDAVKHLVLVPGREAPAEARPRRLPVSAEGHCRQDLGRQLHVPAVGRRGMTDRPHILLAHHLKTLKLQTFLREYEKVARQCAAEGLDHVQFLARLVELEPIDRERRMVERRIEAAKFPVAKSLDSFDFQAIPALNKAQVLELARCEWIERRENVIALGPSGTGKTHVALGLGLAACQRGLSTGFTTAATLVHESMEARDRAPPPAAPEADGRLHAADHRRAGLRAAEQGPAPSLLFELISQRYERGATLITSNLPFDEWNRDLRLRAPDRGAARPSHPSRQHPRDERRQLPPQPEPRPQKQRR